VFDAIVAHPFLRGVADGTLEPARFAFFIAQDSHYVRSYTQCLSQLAGRAADEDIMRMLVAHAAGTIGQEVTLHAELFDALGLDYQEALARGASPTTFAYTNYLFASCERAGFLEGFVSLLPCYWIYAQVGAHLSRVDSPHPVYARWIENYHGGDYEQVVVQALDQVDALAERAGPAERQNCVERYRRGAQYEWMFWDAAYRLETWPI
jgi:thiaminase/transcriptional activator TenA